MFEWTHVFLFISYLTSITCFNDEELKISLRKPIFNTWSFKNNFTDFISLKLDEESIKHGMKENGDETNKALERIYDKVKNGLNITMLVLGGSATKGADLGCYNTQCTYHYALMVWWNAIIAPVTGSFMKREVIAVGGTGTTYFGHCWQEYLFKDEVIDIVSWEFYLNDPDSYHYGSGLEKFVRSVLKYKTKPALIFNKFFIPSTFPGERRGLRWQSGVYKAKTVETMSKYYGFSIMDLLPAVENHLKIAGYNSLLKTEMFIGIHPSHLAHAQLGYILIEYIRKQILSLVWKKWIKGPLMTAASDPVLPSVLYGALDYKSICWSGVMPDDRFAMPHNLYYLRVTYKDGFSIYPTPPWVAEIANRRDVRGGYITGYPGKYIIITFDINRSQKNVYIAISHEESGGNTSFVVKDSKGKQQENTLDCSRKNIKGMDIHFLGLFSPGNAELIVETISGGCHFSALILE